MNFKRFFSIQFFFVLTYIYSVKAITCFQCGAKDNGCDKLTIENKTSPYYLPCPSDDNTTYFCRKIVQKVEYYNLTRITRECGWLTEYPGETTCMKYDTQEKRDSTCQCYEDGCNSAQSVLENLHIFAAGLIVNFIFVYVWK